MAVNLTEKAMLVNLSISQWTARKYDRKVSHEINMQHGADDDAGRYNKCLVARESLKELTKVVNRARIFHYENTLPWADEGSRILPAAMFPDYSAKMRELKNEFETAVDAFLSTYPSLIEDACISLNGLFREEDYPPTEHIVNKFAWGVSISPLPIASDFRVMLSDDEISKIRGEIENRNSTASITATRDLWERLYKAVSHMADKLAEPDAIFRDSLVGNIQELTALLPKLNITDDAELEKMRRQVETRLGSTIPETLRTDSKARENTATIARDLLDTMKGYMG